MNKKEQIHIQCVSFKKSQFKLQQSFSVRLWDQAGHMSVDANNTKTPRVPDSQTQTPLPVPWRKV
jgi:hypothetical protein